MVSPLFLDLYELTMAQAYFLAGKAEQKATFELFARKFPKNWGFLIALGIQGCVEFAENLKFGEEELAFLQELGFRDDFLDFLSKLRFKGEIKAVEEGEVIFENEPALQVTAPIAIAQLLETAFLNFFAYQSAVATKAARIVIASKGKNVADFGARRAPSIEASLLGARASYIAGINLTSNVLASKIYGIKATGTVAHSFIQSFEKEIEAFETFARIYGEQAILLIDTYDTLKGAQKAIKLWKKGLRFRGVRIDSGDLLELSKKVRAMLDRAGLKKVIIVASGGLDEYRIDELLSKNAPIDAFGVGTALLNPEPLSNAVYKLVEVEIEGEMRPVSKKGKAYFGGAKQVYRFESYDLIAHKSEELDGEKLLKEPRRFELDEIKNKVAERLSRLPEGVKRIRNPEKFRVLLSEKMQRIQEALKLPHLL